MKREHKEARIVNVILCTYAVVYSWENRRKSPLKNPMLGGLLAVSSLLFFNLLTLIVVIFGRTFPWKQFPKPVAVAVILFILFFFHLYFRNRQRQKHLIGTYDALSPERRRRCRVVAWSYIVATPIVYFISGYLFLLPQGPLLRPILP